MKTKILACSLIIFSLAACSHKEIALKYKQGENILLKTGNVLSIVDQWEDGYVVTGVIKPINKKNIAWISESKLEKIIQ
jgi:hypothetical protein